MPVCFFCFLIFTPGHAVKLFRLFVFASLVLMCHASAFAEGATLHMTTFSVEKQDNDLFISSGIRVQNIEQVRDQLRDGAQMLLKGTVTLHRLRTLLTNQLVGEGDLVLHLRHDPLRRDFLVFRGKELFKNRNLAQVLSAAWDAAPITLKLREPLIPGDTYRVTMLLTMQHAEVPPWLEKALFFWSWDVVPSLELTQDFQF